MQIKQGIETADAFHQLSITPISYQCYSEWTKINEHKCELQTHLY